jgi:hypothetical protein
MKKLLAMFFSLAFISSTPAQFFGGYADGVTSVPTGKNTFGPALRMVYDDFTFDLPGNIVQFQMVGRNNTIGAVGMQWEIRAGVSAGNGGTLLVSGFALSGTFSPLPLDGSFGTPPAGPGQYGYFDSAPSIPIPLTPGTYWIGLAPIEQGGSWDVTSSQGLGGIGHPLNNGNAYYYDSSNPGANFVSMGADDFGLRIFTDVPTVVVPEPGSLALLGLAILGFLLRARR